MDTDIKLYEEAWAPGTRTKAQLGPISCEVFVDDREPAPITAWIKAQLKLLEVLRDEARAVCANAVLGLEITLDPFAYASSGEHSGVRLSARGAAVILESTA